MITCCCSGHESALDQGHMYQEENADKTVDFNAACTNKCRFVLYSAPPWPGYWYKAGGRLNLAEAYLITIDVGRIEGRTLHLQAWLKLHTVAAAHSAAYTFSS